MNIRATSNFRPGDFARLEAVIVPRITRAVEAGARAVKEEAQAIVPVDTGALKDSMLTPLEIVGWKVIGYVEAPMPYAAYVEFGTGVRGAESPGAGPYAYTMTWTGMVAQPYLRPALDTARPAIIGAYREEGFTTAAA